MPIQLKEAPVGTIVRPPCHAYKTMNCFALIGVRKYVVVRKEEQCVFLNQFDGFFANTPSSEKEGVFQVKGNEFFLTESDEPAKEDPQMVFEPKKRAVGTYVFAFDDDEIKLEKMPRQALVLADILHETGKSEFTEAQIEEILNLPANREQFKTKQAPMSIFRFYRSQFERLGFLKRKKT